MDIFVGTFGKAFGVNGGFVAGSQALVDALRQKADTYIYTNPLGAADCAAAVTAVDIADSGEGRERLANLKARTEEFRAGLQSLGCESIPGPHPVVPLLVRDTERTRAMVRGLFERGILAVGLTYPGRAARRRHDPLPDQRRAHQRRHRRGARGARGVEIETTEKIFNRRRGGGRTCGAFKT